MTSSCRVLLWFSCSRFYASELCNWHCGNYRIAPMPAKQPWRIWVIKWNAYTENNIDTTKQGTTRPCACVWNSQDGVCIISLLCLLRYWINIVCVLSPETDCIYALQWRHNGHGGVSNHQPHDCLLNSLFRRRSKKIWKLRVTGLCEGNSPVTGEFPAQRASNAENVSI